MPPRRKPDLKAFAICYDPTLIPKPKTFHIQTISTLFALMGLCLSPANLAFFNRWYLKSSSPRKPLEDIEIISAVFTGSGISEEFGKIIANHGRD
jgi:hypothetical protein